MIASSLITTGAGSYSKLFAKSGYRVAVLGRSADRLKGVADTIQANPGQVSSEKKERQGTDGLSDSKSLGSKIAPFAVDSYSRDNLQSVFSSIKQTWPDAEVRVTVWNAGSGIWKPFLELAETEVQECIDTNIVGAFAFARESILAFKDLS